jgi:hypothetical protein
MKNCEPFIHHILDTTSNELLIKFWRQQLKKEQEQAAATNEIRLIGDEYRTHEASVLESSHL